MKLLLQPLLITASLLIALTSHAQYDFNDWDTDNDGVIEHYEFTTIFTDEFYKSWDATYEEGIIEEGFFENEYAGLDADNDNMLSDEEWLVGYNYFYDDYLVTDEYALVDADNDGYVDYAEYYDVLYDTDYFTDIDMDEDNFISEWELADYVFDNWDIDNNGTLSRSEYNRFDWYYLDV